MRRILSATAALALLAAGPAMAQPACPLPYAAFEAAVPHIDLETCPASVTQQKVMCRLTINQAQLHLFVFAEDGDQCLISVKTLEPDDYTLTLK